MMLSFLYSPVRILGVEFCPILVPLRRRLQTLSVFISLVLCLFLPALAYPAILYVLLVSPYWKEVGIVIAPYLLWIWVIDRNCCERGARSSAWVRNWTLWKWGMEYFPVTLVKTETADLDKAQNYLFCYHPHGIFCCGMQAAFGPNANQADSLFPGFTFSNLSFVAPFRTPITRDIGLLLGNCSASRASMNHLLSAPGGGRVAVLTPGGAEEAMDCHPNSSYVIHLKEKKGFIKVALQNGSPLVPVFGFGETSTYDQVGNPKGSRLRAVQDWLQKVVKSPPALLIGRGFFQYSFGLLPRRTPITVVVGAPIPVDKVSQPTQSQIDDLHLRYMTSLVALFYSHRDQYASGQSITIV